MNLTAYVGGPVTQVERGWFYDYQTFIGAMIALIAALIAAEIARRQLKAAREQIVEARRQTDLDRAGRLRAARASFPAVLSAICDYADATARALYGAWPAVARLYPNDVDEAQDYRITAEIPPFPVGTLDALERVVELTSAEDVADRIESLLREAQVLGARTRKLETGDNLTVGHLSAYILQAASIYARAESLFEYARRQRDGLAVEPLWARVFVALSMFDIHEEQILAMARRERDRGDPPGEADTLPVY
jgi:type II secretory pathway pseudopilin PulG